MTDQVNITLIARRTFSWQDANWSPEPAGRAAIMARFWSNVNQRTDSECWLWGGYRNPCGYGVFGIGRDRILAHRFAWLASRGDIGGGLSVCHNCDTPACVNPNHLRVDTTAGNIHESVRKGRKKAWGLQKLNAEQVQEIRFRASCGQLQKDIAAAFGISRNHVSSIVHRTSWAHLKAGEPGLTPARDGRRVSR